MKGKVKREYHAWGYYFLSSCQQVDQLSPENTLDLEDGQQTFLYDVSQVICVCQPPYQA